MKIHRLTGIVCITQLFLTLSATSSPPPPAPSILIDDFKNGLKSDWQTKIFQGTTQYASTVEDGIPCIKAVSNKTASGLVYKIQFDPRKYPKLKWQWKIDNIIQKADARTKKGDDYPARIYIAFPAIFFWNTKVLNYIWSTKLPAGEAIKSSYSKNFAMISVENGRGNLGKWRTYETNIYDDYKENFGEEPPKAGAIAIMTDTDNTGEHASACYGAISIHAE